MATKSAALVGYDTAGFLTGLRTGLVEIGWRCETVGPPHPFNYGVVSDGVGGGQPGITRRRYNAIRASLGNKSRSPGLKGTLIRVLVRTPLAFSRSIVMLPRAVSLLRRNDVVLYNSGATVSGNVFEPWIANRLGTQVISCFHGSDVRPAYLNGALLSDGDPSPRTLRRLVREQKRTVRRAEKHSQMIVTWSGITHFFVRSLYLHERLGFPLNIDDFPPYPQSSADAQLEAQTKPVVLHMPTNPAAKGTSEILACMDHLRDSGVEFVANIQAGLDHHDALHQVITSDIVVDQIFADSATGVLAAESSFFRRPVVVASKDASWFRDVLGDDLPRTCFVQTSEVTATLENLIKHPAQRRELADCGFEYFAERWRPDQVAKAYIEALAGERTAQLMEPLQLTAARGGFAPIDRLRSVVRTFVETLGSRALGLEHNPTLRENVLDEFVR